MEGFLLNEQTWLQHLKEKRLAYGLSQNRLAVATGITRQYLSDIETGKVKPSEDLQQSLWEALERFNPDAPLEMLFDYVRIRFPTTDVQQVVENILQLKLSYFLHEDYGFYSYSEHYYINLYSFNQVFFVRNTCKFPVFRYNKRDYAEIIKIVL